ncbi:MAG: hypothetical protein HKO77_10740 [Gemmatimonadetes bacterium]|nr:hypothetical protein [Gemmatimonadota bacterium]
MTDTAFRHDLEAVFHRAAEAGVTRMVTIASDLDDALRAAELAAARSRCWSTAGVHPHAAGDASPDTVAKLRGLLAHDDVVAVGETGLDYHYDNAAPSVQRALFDAIWPWEPKPDSPSWSTPARPMTTLPRRSATCPPAPGGSSIASRAATGPSERPWPPAGGCPSRESPVSSRSVRSTSSARSRRTG